MLLNIKSSGQYEAQLRLDDCATFNRKSKCNLSKLQPIPELLLAEVSPQ